MSLVARSLGAVVASSGGCRADCPAHAVAARVSRRRRIEEPDWSAVPPCLNAVLLGAER
jgi:hypothetical protein